MQPEAHGQEGLPDKFAPVLAIANITTFLREAAMATLQELANDYLAGPKFLRQAVADMTREQLLARPVAGKMTTLEVICHLSDFEPIMADRMKRVIAEENPTL